MKKIMLIITILSIVASIKFMDTGYDIGDNSLLTFGLILFIISVFTFINIVSEMGSEFLNKLSK